jgi:hypothetical protein
MLGPELGKWGQKMSRMRCVEYVFWELESCISVNIVINTDTRSSFGCSLSPAFYCLCILFLYLLFLLYSFFVSLLFLLPVFSLVFFTTYLSTQTTWFQFLEVLIRNILEGGARSVAAEVLRYKRKSRVQSPMVSLEFFINIILPATVWPWGRFSLW